MANDAHPRQMPGIVKRDLFNLNAGFKRCTDGFTEHGLSVIPQTLQDTITRCGFASYGELVLDRIHRESSSNYWAPEVRDSLMQTVLVPYIFGFIQDMQLNMSLELERRVKDPANSEWTHEKAQHFARNEAGKLLLALFGDLSPTLAQAEAQPTGDNDR